MVPSHPWPQNTGNPAMVGNHPRLRPYAAVLNRLDQSQWLATAKLAGFQFRCLNALVRHACRTVPYYRRQFAAVGLAGADISPDNWPAVPILKRRTLQEDPLLSREIPPRHGRLFESQTSGSTGQPVKVYCTGLAQFYFRVLNIRDHLWHRRDMTRKHAAIRYFPEGEIPPEGLSADQWGQAIGALFGAGPSVTQSIRLGIADQVKWLVEKNPDYLLTYPSNLSALIDYCTEHGIHLGNLREFRTLGETVPASLRERCRQIRDLPLTDVYSSQEVGVIALQCPEQEHYHVQAESVLLEVLDDNGRPCPPGTVGRVVVTALHNYATPLIRYEIRDYAEVGEPCPCGRGLPVLKRIVGRQRNMLTLPNGEKRWPVFDWTRYREVAPIRQFQFIQTSREQVEMRLVCDRTLTATDRERLITLVQKALGHPFAVTLTPLPEIPLGKNGKYEEFISQVRDEAG